MLRRSFLKGIAALLACPLIPTTVKKEIEKLEPARTWTTHFGKVVGHVQKNIVSVKRLVFQSGWSGSGGKISGSWSGFVEDDGEPWTVYTDAPVTKIGDMVAFVSVTKTAGIAIQQTVPE